MAFDIQAFPAFSWSQSRRGMFQECPRLYFWQYYGSHNGWLDDADPVARAAWRLKQMTNLHLCVGSEVHALIAKAILHARGGMKPFTAKELIDEGRRALNRAYVEAQKQADWERAPKYRTMLHEFYYGTGPADTLIDKIKHKLVTCLTNFLNSQSYREAIAAPFVEVKDVDRMAALQVGGHTIWAQPDLLYRTGDGEYHIVDWKTGAEEDLHVRQLTYYGLYVRSKPELAGEHLRGHLEYLFSGERVSSPVTDADLQAAEQEIADSIASMQGYLADVDMNQPRAKEEFPLTSDRGRCRFCKFFELCRDEIELVDTRAGPFST